MTKDRRLYAKFTLDFADSPKIMPLSDAAFRALVEMTLWSRRMMTDGVLASRYAVARWSLEVLEELTSNDPSNPSLIEVEGGWLIHDFASHQDTKADIEARRERNKAAGRKGGMAKSKRTAKHVAKQSASEVLSENVAETETHITTSSPNSSSPDDDREDVDQLVDTLIEAVKARDVRVPSSLNSWRTEARRLLDIDKRPLDEALAVLKWSQSDPFWSKNILAMPKFRAKYDQLRLKADIKPAMTPDEFLRECWRTGSTAPITKLTGHQPDPFRWPEPTPEDFNQEEAMRAHRRTWLESNRDTLTASLQGRV